MASTFRFRKDAQGWFKHVEGTEACKEIFDMYYYCFMAGMASGQRSNPGDRKSAPGFLPLGAGFVKKYSSDKKSLIIGLLIYAEINRHGLQLKEKEDVMGKIRELVDADAASKLSDRGIELLNEYASGGYDVIEEKRSSPPDTAEEFLRWYPDFLARLLKKKSFLMSK